MNTTPWIEKYRPSKFNQIILDKDNKILLENIVKFNMFPNLLLYGPPGTGKTTTIINIIEKYQKAHNQMDKCLSIHLNASDDRGIDIIRNQITQFVNTKSLFNDGLKFVILDEVDYMTKNAQQALRHLIQLNNNNVRFCLICNYISRIDESLKSEFIRLRFCNLPKSNILTFLKKIIVEEKVDLTDTQLEQIITRFDVDIRSMINYIQLNNDTKNIIISNKTWEETIKKLKSGKNEKITNYINDNCTKYNINLKSYLIEFFNYILSKKKYSLNTEWLNNIQYIIHNNNVDDEYILDYFINKFIELYKIAK